MRLRLPVCGAAVCALLLAACGESSTTSGTDASPSASSAGAQSPCAQGLQSDPSVTAGGAADNFSDGASQQATTTADGLAYTDITAGGGDAIRAGDCVTMQYTGWLQANQKMFDSSRTRQGGFPFKVGGGQVIKGWDEGVPGMKVGGKRRLVIPAALGYGAQGTPDGAIPPNATLVFVVEVVRVYPGG